MRFLVHATFITVIAQSWTACDKKDSDKKAPAPSVPTIADQVGNTRSPEDVTMGWAQISDRIKAQAESINTQVGNALYMTADAAQDSCAGPKATYTSVKNTTSGAVHPYYYRCDAKPSCQMLIAEFKDNEKRSWTVAASEELYILAQFIKEAELVAVSESCGPADTLATNIANYGISDLGYTFQNVSDQDFAALLSQTYSKPTQNNSDTIDEEEEYLLLPTFTTALTAFSESWGSIYTDAGTGTLRTVLPAAECAALFAGFKGLMQNLERDTRKVASTVRDLKNYLTIDPGVKILDGENNPYRDMFASSVGFESFVDGALAGSGYIGTKGDAEKVVAQIFAKIEDNSLEPMVETLLSDMILNKIYFNSSTGSSIESNGTLTKMKSDMTLVFDVENFTLDFSNSELTNGSISYEGSGSIQLKDGMELIRIFKDSEGENSKERITKDVQSAQCTVSSK